MIHRALSDQEKIQDIPILIFPPSQFFTGPSEHTFISLKNDCSTNPGDYGDAKLLGACYEMYIEEEPSHNNLLALTLELQKLTLPDQKIEVSNIEELKQEIEEGMKDAREGRLKEWDFAEFLHRARASRVP